MGGTVIWRVIGDSALALLYGALAVGLCYGLAKPRALVERMSRLSGWWVRWLCLMLTIAAVWVALANGFDAAARLMVDRLGEVAGP